MRPKRQEQAPHHFIRRWPKDRRVDRGPSEIKQVVRAQLITLDYTAPEGRLKADLTHKLVAEALAKTPKNFTLQTRPAPEISYHHSLATGIVAATAIFTYSKKKE